MLQLAYLSEATEQYPDVNALAQQASPRNAAEEITGILMHRAGYYLQVLEGPKEVVEDAFLRIIGDRRHDQLQLLSRKMIARREFGDWSMAAVHNHKSKDDVVSRVRELMSPAPHELRVIFESKFG